MQTEWSWNNRGQRHTETSELIRSVSQTKCYVRSVSVQKVVFMETSVVLSSQVLEECVAWTFQMTCGSCPNRTLVFEVMLSNELKVWWCGLVDCVGLKATSPSHSVWNPQRLWMFGDEEKVFVFTWPFWSLSKQNHTSMAIWRIVLCFLVYLFQYLKRRGKQPVDIFNELVPELGNESVDCGNRSIWNSKLASLLSNSTPHRKRFPR